MATFMVTTTADGGPGSLRQAVADANARSGADAVAFDPAVFDGEAEDVVRLTDGQVQITGDLTIDGGAAGVTITGDADGDDVTLAGGITDVAASLAGEDLLDDNSRLFDATAALTLEGLTLTGGRTTADREAGGAVRATGDLTLLDVTVAGNSTAGDYADGGGVFGRRAVALTDSRVSNNGATGYRARGGGVFGDGFVSFTNSTVMGNSTMGGAASGGGVLGAIVTLTDSTVSGNSAAGDSADGGGVYGINYVSATNSTISGNSVSGDDARGGGVIGLDIVTLTNSTVSGNSAAGAGGGVYGLGFVGANNSTIALNAAAEGGGLFVRGFGGLPALASSIVAENAGGDLVGYIVSGGSNLIGDGSGGGEFVNGVNGDIVGTPATPIDPLLGPLQDNDGPTLTHAPLAGSPVIDAGANPLGLDLDQRGSGFARTAGRETDIGAVESPFTTPPPPPTETPSLTVTTALDVADPFDGLTSLREAVAFVNNGLFAAGSTVTFDAAVFDDEAADVVRLIAGQIAITQDLTIDGGLAGVTISGDAAGDDVTLAGGITDVDASLAGEDRLDDNSRLFDTRADVTLARLTLTGGRTTGGSEDGGAVRAASDMTLIGVTVAGNSTAGDFAYGGGISGGYYSFVTLRESTISGNSTAGGSARGGGVNGRFVTLTDSAVSGNSTTGRSASGGGVFGDDVTLTASTVSGNSTAGGNARGGGVYGYTATLTASTVSGNAAAGDNADGGGVFGGDVTLTNSTVSGNAAAGASARGGGVSGVAVTLTNTTVARNAAPEAGGVAVSSNATLTSTIVAENAGGDLGFDASSGRFLSSGNNLIGDGSGGGAFVNGVAGDIVGRPDDPVDPLLGPLQDNGGPTRTHALLAGSPAIDAGANPLALAFDQRGPGFPREAGAAPDIGAVEAAAEGPPVFVESDRNSRFRLRDVFEAPAGGTIRAALRPDGVDRDFFELRGFAPGDVVALEVVLGGFDSTLGLFDAQGRRIAVDDDGGEGLLSRLIATADAHGAIRAAVSGFDDFDFDGKSDSRGGPHGRSGDYRLEATVVADPARLVVPEAGLVTVTAGDSEAGAVNALLLRDLDSGETVVVFEDEEAAAGQRFTLGPFAASARLEFAILVNGVTEVGGVGPDGQAQAVRTDNFDGSVTIGFEDILRASGGSDGDFDDVVFDVAFTPGGETRARVARSSDDAEQAGPRAAIDLDDGVLEIAASPSKLVGLRFAGLDTPEGAEIVEAYIRFRANRSFDGASTVEIALEDDLAARTFGTGARTIAAREYIAETVAWTPEATVRGRDFRTPDLSGLVETLLAGDDVEAGDAFAFRLTGLGGRNAWSFDGSGPAPELVIVYAAPAAPDGFDPLGLG